MSSEAAAAPQNSSFEHKPGSYADHYYRFGPGKPGGQEPDDSTPHFGSSRGDGLGIRGDEYLYVRGPPRMERKHYGSTRNDGLGLRGDEYLSQSKPSLPAVDFAQVLIRTAQGVRGDDYQYQSKYEQNRFRASRGHLPTSRPSVSSYYPRPRDEAEGNGIFGSLPVPSVLPVQMQQPPPAMTPAWSQGRPIYKNEPGPLALTYINEPQLQLTYVDSQPQYELTYANEPQYQPPPTPMSANGPTALGDTGQQSSGLKPLPGTSFSRPHAFVPRMGRYDEQSTTLV